MKRNKFPTDPELLLRILDWILAEQMDGRSPTSVDVGKAFEMTAEEAERIREELEKMGEFD